MFPKCKVCGAGIFLTEEAFVQHFSQNHYFPKNDKPHNNNFDNPESQNSSTKENNETEVEQTNDLSENDPILENQVNEKPDENQDVDLYNDESQKPSKENKETEVEHSDELTDNDSILENNENFVCPKKLNKTKKLLSTITKRRCIVKIEKINLKHYKLRFDEDQQCEICNKVFTRKYSLAKHIKIVHEGVKNHECETCGKSFGISSELKKHIARVHEGIKKYKCQYCNARFSEKANLANHIRRIHEKKKINYTCEFCEEVFTRKDYVKAHIQRVHDGKKNYKVAIINYVVSISVISKIIDSLQCY